MKLFKTAKGKAVVLALVVFLVAGGAVAGAASPGFASTIQSYVSTLQTKLTALVGKEVKDKARVETKAVTDHVTTEFGKATTEIANHYSKEVKDNTARLTTNKNEAITEINAAVTSATSQVKHTITETAKNETDAAITKMNADVNAHINTIMTNAVNSVPNVITK